MCVCARVCGFVYMYMCESTTLPGRLLVEVHWRNAEPAAHSSFLLSPVTVGCFFFVFFLAPGAPRGEIWRGMQQEDVKGEKENKS